MKTTCVPTSPSCVPKPHTAGILASWHAREITTKTNNLALARDMCAKMPNSRVSERRKPGDPQKSIDNYESVLGHILKTFVGSYSAPTGIADKKLARFKQMFRPKP